MSEQKPRRCEVDIPVADGEKHGYWGRSQDPVDRTEYTVAGHLGATATVTDKPKSLPHRPIKRPTARPSSNS